MNRQKFVTFVFTMAVWGALLAASPVAQAGPPLICHRIDIGQAKSLPWTSDTWHLSGKESYDLNRLVEDTATLLVPGVPVLVRMETLRRATLYAQKDPEVSKKLLWKLRSRALEAEGKGHPDALAWFDLGYLVECYKQANWDYVRLPSGGQEKRTKPNPAMNMNGYAWVSKALSMRGNDPEMEFAAALITLEGPPEQHRQHVQKALAGAKSNPLLAANLKGRFIGENSPTMAELLDKKETAKK